jgi:hypothetical protein
MIEQNIDIKINKNKWDPILVSLFESEQEKKAQWVEGMNFDNFKKIMYVKINNAINRNQEEEYAMILISKIGIEKSRKIGFKTKPEKKEIKLIELYGI